MELKSRYKLSYTLNKEPKDLILDIELRQTEGIPKPFQNVWQGFAVLNGQPYDKEDLSHCVNAKFAAERIGHKLRDDLKVKAKKENIPFRIKNEELKVG
jgi:hypothetical protein